MLGFGARSREERSLSDGRIRLKDPINAGPDRMRHRHPTRHTLLVGLRSLEDATERRCLRSAEVNVLTAERTERGDPPTEALHQQ